MKVKTSVTLSPELILAIDRRRDGPGHRSAFIERAAWETLHRETAGEMRDEEIARLNALADNPREDEDPPFSAAVPYWQLGDEFED